MREVEKIRHEREEQQAKQEREQQELDKAKREGEIARGNPLLNTNPLESGGKRRWDEDVVFRNQARGTENKGPKEFVNVRCIRPLRVLGRYQIADFFIIDC